MAKLKCSKCDRKFSMPAHLARHMNTIHARGGRKAGRSATKAGKRRGPGRPPGRRSAGPSAGSYGTGASADRVIREMRAYHGALMSQRESLDSQISSLEDALLNMGAATSGARRGRPPGSGKRGPKPTAARRGPGRPPGSGTRAGSLKDFIVKVLRQRSGPMSPREIATAVKSSGYKSKAADLTKAVSNALPKLKSVSKAGHGLYKA